MLVHAIFFRLKCQHMDFAILLTFYPKDIFEYHTTVYCA